MGGMSPSPSPDRMHMLRVCTLAKTKCMPFETSVTDPTSLNQLYQAIQALPKIPANAVMHCPLDNGIRYHLDFFQGGNILSQVILDASGCRALHLTTTDTRQTNAAFWALLAREIGVSTTDLLAVP